ncbi:hypothetical protein RB195_016490 [Necator americanus]|uniref:Secreted protein n=1 Tax=Necator americanus TaxID=51031 RepID=A0ABR1C309_NECAM
MRLIWLMIALGGAAPAYLPCQLSPCPPPPLSGPPAPATTPRPPITGSDCNPAPPPPTPPRPWTRRVWPSGGHVPAGAWPWLRTSFPPNRNTG